MVNSKLLLVIIVIFLIVTLLSIFVFSDVFFSISNLSSGGAAVETSMPIPL